MAEPRRVQLTSLGRAAASPTSLHAPAPVSQPPVERPRSHQPAGTGTVRLHVSLFESDDHNFPEVSYSQLVEDQINQSKCKGPLGMFEKEETREKDELAAIARQLEEKYGGKPKKRKKDRIQDLIDIGYGYDDEDSFIDNSEAYDEFVPASITTKFGGFYVNYGMLQYRQASDTEMDELTTAGETPETSKRRKLTSGPDKLKTKRCRDGEKISDMDPVANAPSDNEMKSKKKKEVVRTLSVTSMLKRCQKEKDEQQRRMKGSGGSVLADPLLSLIGSTNDQALIQAASTVDFNIDLDSLLYISEEATQLKALPQPAAETLQIQTMEDNPRHGPCSYTSVVVENPTTNFQLKPHSELTVLVCEDGSASAHQCIQQLPEGLSSGLEESIRKLMAAAKTSEGESKLKFFSPDINSILLDVELQCREQSGPLRSKVYTHLSSFLPCSKDTLLKRAKKLVNTQMEEPLTVKDPMKKLNKAIERTMPQQITCFHESCQAYEQVKMSLVSATDEDNVEEKGGKRGPRKVFKWNNEIRESLSHILKDEMCKYGQDKKKGQEVEEYLKTFLDTEVKPLWPKGWMQSRMLVRESKKLLGATSSLIMKKARTEKRLINGWDDLPPPPAMMEDLPSGSDHGFDTPPSVSLGAALEKVELYKGLNPFPETPSHGDKPEVVAQQGSLSSHLRFLKNKLVLQEQHQERLAAAVAAQFKCPDLLGRFSVDAQNLAQPPTSPLSSVSADVLPQATEPDSVGHETVAPVYVISSDEEHDDDDVRIQ